MTAQRVQPLRLTRRLCAFAAGASLLCAFSLAALGAAPPSAAAGSRYAVTQTIGVAGMPISVAVDPANNTTYVMASDLDAIDEVTDTLVGSINAAPSRTALSVGVDPSRNLVLVPSYPRVPSFHGRLTSIDARTGLIEATTTVGAAPYAVAVDTSTNEALVVDHASNTVSFVNDATHRVVRTVAVGDSPMDIAVDARTGVAYCTNQVGTMSVFSAATGAPVKTISVGSNASSVAVDSGTDTVYVINASGLKVISGTSLRVTATVNFGDAADPSSVAVDPQSHLVFVTLLGTDDLVILSGHSLKRLATIRVGRNPQNVAVDPRIPSAFVTNGEDDTVSVVSYG
jgi:YVTN family beta-propeller protein